MVQTVQVRGGAVHHTRLHGRDPGPARCRPDGYVAEPVDDAYYREVSHTCANDVLNTLVVFNAERPSHFVQEQHLDVWVRL